MSTIILPPQTFFLYENLNNKRALSKEPEFASNERTEKRVWRWKGRNGEAQSGSGGCGCACSVLVLRGSSQSCCSANHRPGLHSRCACCVPSSRPCVQHDVAGAKGGVDRLCVRDCDCACAFCELTLSPGALPSVSLGVSVQGASTSLEVRLWRSTLMLHHSRQQRLFSAVARPALHLPVIGLGPMWSQAMLTSSWLLCAR